MTGGAGSGFGASADTQYDLVAVDSPDPGPGSRFAERLTVGGDLTGDGVPDVFASSYVIDVNGVNEAGKVVLINGATQEIEYELTSPEVQDSAHFGFFISVVGDVNGDGLGDLAVGTDAQDVGGNVNQGKLYVFDGPTGRLLYGIDNPDPQAQARFGSRIGSAGDVTEGEGADIIVGAIANDMPVPGCGNVPTGTPVPADCRKDQGQTYIFDGADGSLERELNIPDADLPPTSCSVDNTCGTFGYAPQVIGDLNRDGFSDHMVPAGTLRPTPDRHGRIYVFSGGGATVGQVLTRIDQPAPDALAFFGLQDTDRLTPGDLNGDGVPEIYGTGFLQDGPNAEPSAGRAWVFDGAKSLASGKGELLYEINDPKRGPSRAFGFAQSRTDYNKDGRGDLYISGLQGQLTETYVFDGRDGSLLKTLGLPPSEAQASVPGNNGSGLGQSVRAPGDLNGDGEPDFVATAHTQDVNGSQDQGRVYFFLSNVPGPGGGTTPTPTPTPGGGDGDDDDAGRRVRPNLVRPRARAVQGRRARSRRRGSGSVVARVSQARGGSRVVVRLRGRMVGNRGRACGGRIKIGTRAGSRRVAVRTGRMGRNCRYTKRYTFAARRLPKRLRPRNRTLVLRIAVRYQGNSLLQGDLSPTKRVEVRR